MKKPRMILFDYGHTLAWEPSQDYLKGNCRTIELAVENPLGITGELLSKTDVGRIIGRTPRTVGKYLQFGGTVTRPVLSRAQLARQIAELTKYSA